MCTIYVTIRDKLASANTPELIAEVGALLDSRDADAIPPAKYETLLWQLSLAKLRVEGELQP